MPKFVINKGYITEKRVEADRHYHQDGMVHFVTDDGSMGLVQNLTIAAKNIITIQIEN